MRKLQIRIWLRILRYNARMICTFITGCTGRTVGEWMGCKANSSGAAGKCDYYPETYCQYLREIACKLTGAGNITGA